MATNPTERAGFERWHTAPHFHIFQGGRGYVPAAERIVASTCGWHTNVMPYRFVAKPLRC
jgi:hypothetical protein